LHSRYDPEVYQRRFENKLLIIDEVQRMPDLFRLLNISQPEDLFGNPVVGASWSFTVPLPVLNVNVFKREHRNHPSKTDPRFPGKKPSTRALHISGALRLTYRPARDGRRQPARIHHAHVQVEQTGHHPHPQKKTDQGALKSVRRFLKEAGISPSFYIHQKASKP